MTPFDHLKRITMVYLLITVVFCVNDFAWNKVASKMLPPLTIVEGILLDFNLHFRVTRGEFSQTYEVIDNNMSLRAVGVMELGSCGDLQGGLRCYNLVSGRVLKQKWKETEAF